MCIQSLTPSRAQESFSSFTPTWAPKSPPGSQVPTRASFPWILRCQTPGAWSTLKPCPSAHTVGAGDAAAATGAGRAARRQLSPMRRPGLWIQLWLGQVPPPFQGLLPGSPPPSTFLVPHPPLQPAESQAWGCSSHWPCQESPRGSGQIPLAVHGPRLCSAALRSPE